MVLGRIIVEIVLVFTTTKYRFNIARLTSVLKKPDVNKNAVAFL